MNTGPRWQERRDHLSKIILATACALLAAAIIWHFSHLALLYVLTDGLLAALVATVATLFGLVLVPFLRDQQRFPLRWQIVIGAGAGLGFLSLATLLLGWLGLLSGDSAVGLLILMGVLGVANLAVRLKRLEQTPRAKNSQHTEQPPGTGAAWLVLILMLPLALSLLAATVPPGLIWEQEAHGYDVLEYHLQIPKEYFYAGQIAYLPHNIYSNFPMNAEMLYLLAMVLKGDPVEAAVLAKMFHVLLGALFVAAAWLAGREYDPRAGMVCALVAGSMPWLLYLCGMAYVENGMLFYGMLTAACLCRLDHLLRENRPPWGYAFTSGTFAGLACGFKYTAIPLIALPFFAALLAYSILNRALLPGRFCSAFALGAVLTFAPWAAKNIAFTGNPVFPLAYAQLGARPGIWTDPLAQRWHQGHQVQQQDQALKRRLMRLKERVLTDSRLGLTHDFSDRAEKRWMILPLPLALAFPILLSRRRRTWDVLLILILLGQVVIWLFFTHLFARFVVVMIIPLAILMGRSLVASDHKAYLLAFACAVLLPVGLNLKNAWQLYEDHLVRDGQSVPVHGRMELLYEDSKEVETPLSYIVKRLYATERILLVGDARAYYYPANVDYCVVFSRNAFAEAVASAPDDEHIIRWLNAQGYEFLLVNRSEIERLSRTYGFWEELNVDLFTRLEQTGLGPIRYFTDYRGETYAVLYEVRQMPTRLKR